MKHRHFVFFLFVRNPVSNERVSLLSRPHFPLWDWDCVICVLQWALLWALFRFSDTWQLLINKWRDRYSTLDLASNASSSNPWRLTCSSLSRVETFWPGVEGLWRRLECFSKCFIIYTEGLSPKVFTRNINKTLVSVLFQTPPKNLSVPIGKNTVKGKRVCCTCCRSNAKYDKKLW